MRDSGSRTGVVALLFLLPIVLPAALDGQQRGGGMGMGMGGMAGGALESLLTSPAGYALEHRGDFEITDEQAPRLGAMHDAWMEENETQLAAVRPMVEAMRARAAGGSGGRMGQGMPGGGDMATMRGAMRGLQEAREAQLEELAGVLLADQLRDLRARLEPRRPG